MESFTGRGSLHGPMDHNTMEIISKERNMDMEGSLTLPGKCTMVIGSTASKRATARFLTNLASSLRKEIGRTAPLRNDHG